MKDMEHTRNLLIEHFRRYPNAQIEDIFKYLHQSTFGSEHLVTSLAECVKYITCEYQSNLERTQDLVEPLDGNFSRVHLGYIAKGLSPNTLGKLFFESAKSEVGEVYILETKLQVVRELIEQKALPFSLAQFDDALASWKETGYGSLHHSEIFRDSYKPSYRVILNEFVSFLPLFAKIDSLLGVGKTVVAIDGGSASGKTTLAATLSKIYDCNVIHVDDFFLRPEQRTPDRLSEVGGNMDRERLLEEVLIPLSKDLPIRYRKYDCSTMTLGDDILLTKKPLTIIEGAYSMHPDLTKYYDLGVFLDISNMQQRTRIEKRNSAPMAKRFFNEWIPLENLYFEKTCIRERAELVFKC